MQVKIFALLVLSMLAVSCICGMTRKSLRSPPAIGTIPSRYREDARPIGVAPRAPPVFVVKSTIVHRISMISSLLAATAPAPAAAKLTITKWVSKISDLAPATATPAIEPNEVVPTSNPPPPPGLPKSTVRVPPPALTTSLKPAIPDPLGPAAPEPTTSVWSPAGIITVVAVSDWIKSNSIAVPNDIAIQSQHVSAESQLTTSSPDQEPAPTIEVSPDTAITEVPASSGSSMTREIHTFTTIQVSPPSSLFNSMSTISSSGSSTSFVMLPPLSTPALALTTPTLTPSLSAPTPAFPFTENLSALHTGDLTYYAPNLGACGITNSANDSIVAISHLLWDFYQDASNMTNPNLNPLCGRTIEISRRWEGSGDADASEGLVKSVRVKVEDRCTGCEVTDLDVPERVHRVLVADSEEVGRVEDMWWRWVGEEEV